MSILQDHSYKIELSMMICIHRWIYYNKIKMADFTKAIFPPVLY